MSIHVRNDDLDKALPIGGNPDLWRVHAFNEAALVVEPNNLPDLDITDPSAKGVTIAELNQRDMSGQRVAGLNSRYAGIDIYGNDEDERERKKIKTTQAGLNSIAASGTFNLTVENVVQYLGDSVKLDKAWLNMQDDYIEVTPDQMLHVKDGVRIDPKDDPEGKYLVKTLEEKQAYENSTRTCTMYKAQDEVMSMEDENGNTLLVNKKIFEERQSLTSEIERKEDVIARVERGELAPEDIDQDLQDEVKNRAEGVSPQAPEMSAQDVLASLGPEPQATEPLLRPVISPQTQSPALTPGF